MEQLLGWVAPVMCVLLQNPLNSDPSGFGGPLLMRLSRLISTTLAGPARLAARRTLQALLARLPAEVLGGRCVRPLQVGWGRESSLGRAVALVVERAAPWLGHAPWLGQSCSSPHQAMYHICEPHVPITSR